MGIEGIEALKGGEKLIPNANRSIMNVPLLLRENGVSKLIGRARIIDDSSGLRVEAFVDDKSAKQKLQPDLLYSVSIKGD